MLIVFKIVCWDVVFESGTSPFSEKYEFMYFIAYI